MIDLIGPTMRRHSAYPAVRGKGHDYILRRGYVAAFTHDIRMFFKSRLYTIIPSMATEKPTPTTQADESPSTPQPLHPVTHWENLAAVSQFIF
jgi:hypothetical protein